MEKNLHFDFNAPLNLNDSETQTYGCRQNNPNICKYNGIKDICAFVREDNTCMQPSRAWKKQYDKLKQEH